MPGTIRIASSGVRTAIGTITTIGTATEIVITMATATATTIVTNPNTADRQKAHGSKGVGFFMLAELAPYLVAQCLSRFQSVLNSLLRFLFSAERFEGLAFKVKNILFADRSACS